MLFGLSFLMLISLLFNSCKEKTEEKPKDWSKINKELIEVNKNLIKIDREKILKYIELNELQMTENKSGLWFYVTKLGKGQKIKENQTATLNYKIELLDGTLCYSSDNDGSMTFKVGKAQVATGLQQGVLEMRKGDKAIFIIPPYLAYGLVGDDNKIPGRATLVYTVELLKID